MQDDDFLKQYQQDWQQDAETLDKGLNIPLSTLHRNIQSSQPQPKINFKKALSLAFF